MFELLYTSVSNVSLDDSSSIALLEQARTFNGANDISGILLYDGYLFMQLLEGEEETVRALYERIKTDPRHTNVSLVHCGSITERSFPYWNMLYEFVEDGIIRENLTTLQSAIPKRPHIPSANYGARLQSIILRDYKKFIQGQGLVK